MESSDPQLGRGRSALAVGSNGEIRTAAWVRDAKTGKDRRKRPQGRDAAVAYWTADTYARTAEGSLKRVQARGETKADAMANLRIKLNPAEVDALALAMRGEGAHAELTNDS